jgi:hypothetical protein
MKRLIKKSGPALDRILRGPDDIVTVYHGTAAGFIDDILASGLTEMIENSAQSSGVSYGAGIWVTLNYNVALSYAKDAAKAFETKNKDSTDQNITQYFGYGAILEMQVDKSTLTDEGSASNNNLKSKEVIIPSKIKQIYVVNVKNNATFNYF